MSQNGYKVVEDAIAEQAGESDDISLLHQFVRGRLDQQHLSYQVVASALDDLDAPVAIQVRLPWTTRYYARHPTSVGWIAVDDGGSPEYKDLPRRPNRMEVQYAINEFDISLGLVEDSPLALFHNANKPGSLQSGSNNE